MTASSYEVLLAMKGAWNTLPDNPKPAMAVRIGLEVMPQG